MTPSQLMKLGKLKGRDVVLVVLKHNKRTMENDPAHIDVTRTYLNYALHGIDTPENIALHAKVQITKAGIESLRKDAVMGVEILFSLPINRHEQDTSQFFIDCCEWVKKTFAGELLSFDVHLDEAAPHAHAVILPLINGKMQGSDMAGNYRQLQNSFHDEVAGYYGLSRGDKKRLSKADEETLERQVLRRLKGDSVMSSCIWAVVRDVIKQDPMLFAQFLSIELPVKTKIKQFVDFKRAKGKGTFVK